MDQLTLGMCLLSLVGGERRAVGGSVGSGVTAPSPAPTAAREPPHLSVTLLHAERQLCQVAAARGGRASPVASVVLQAVSVEPGGAHYNPPCRDPRRRSRSQYDQCKQGASFGPKSPPCRSGLYRRELAHSRWRGRSRQQVTLGVRYTNKLSTPADLRQETFLHCPRA